MSSADGAVESWETAGDEIGKDLDQARDRIAAEEKRQAERLAKQAAELRLAARTEEEAGSGEADPFQGRQVKIMRRPESATSLQAAAAASTLQTSASELSLPLEERERRYNEARLRIFGSVEPMESPDNPDGVAKESQLPEGATPADVQNQTTKEAVKEATKETKTKGKKKGKKKAGNGGNGPAQSSPDSETPPVIPADSPTTVPRVVSSTSSGISPPPGTRVAAVQPPPTRLARRPAQEPHVPPDFVRQPLPFPNSTRPTYQGRPLVRPPPPNPMQSLHQPAPQRLPAVNLVKHQPPRQQTKAMRGTAGFGHLPQNKGTRAIDPTYGAPPSLLTGPTVEPPKPLIGMPYSAPPVSVPTASPLHYPGGPGSIHPAYAPVPYTTHSALAAAPAPPHLSYQTHPRPPPLTRTPSITITRPIPPDQAVPTLPFPQPLLHPIYRTRQWDKAIPPAMQHPRPPPLTRTPSITITRPIPPDQAVPTLPFPQPLLHPIYRTRQWDKAIPPAMQHPRPPPLTRTPSITITRPIPPDQAVPTLPFPQPLLHPIYRTRQWDKAIPPAMQHPRPPPLTRTPSITITRPIPPDQAVPTLPFPQPLLHPIYRTRQWDKAIPPAMQHPRPPPLTRTPSITITRPIPPDQAVPTLPFPQPLLHPIYRTRQWDKAIPPAMQHPRPPPLTRTPSITITRPIPPDQAVPTLPFPQPLLHPIYRTRQWDKAIPPAMQHPRPPPLTRTPSITITRPIPPDQAVPTLPFPQPLLHPIYRTRQWDKAIPPAMQHPRPPPLTRTPSITITRPIPPDQAVPTLPFPQPLLHPIYRTRQWDKAIPPAMQHPRPPPLTRTPSITITRPIPPDQAVPTLPFPQPLLHPIYRTRQWDKAIPPAMQHPRPPPLTRTPSITITRPIPPDQAVPTLPFPQPLLHPIYRTRQWDKAIPPAMQHPRPPPLTRTPSITITRPIPPDQAVPTLPFPQPLLHPIYRTRQWDKAIPPAMQHPRPPPLTRTPSITITRPIPPDQAVPTLPFPQPLLHPIYRTRQWDKAIPPAMQHPRPPPLTRTPSITITRPIPPDQAVPTLPFPQPLLHPIYRTRQWDKAIPPAMQHPRPPPLTRTPSITITRPIPPDQAVPTLPFPQPLLHPIYRTRQWDKAIPPAMQHPRPPPLTRTPSITITRPIPPDQAVPTLPFPQPLLHPIYRTRQWDKAIPPAMQHPRPPPLTRTPSITITRPIPPDQAVPTLPFPQPLLHPIYRTRQWDKAIPPAMQHPRPPPLTRTPSITITRPIPPDQAVPTLPFPQPLLHPIYRTRQWDKAIPPAMQHPRPPPLTRTPSITITRPTPPDQAVPRY